MQEAETSTLPVVRSSGSISAMETPAIVAAYGAQGKFAWEEFFSVVEGKTPEITVEQARTLLGSVILNSVVGYPPAVLSVGGRPVA